jgi:hypothetical protein
MEPRGADVKWLNRFNQGGAFAPVGLDGSPLWEFSQAARWIAQARGREFGPQDAAAEVAAVVWVPLAGGSLWAAGGVGSGAGGAGGAGVTPVVGVEEPRPLWAEEPLWVQVPVMEIG